MCIAVLVGFYAIFCLAVLASPHGSFDLLLTRVLLHVYMYSYMYTENLHCSMHLVMDTTQYIMVSHIYGLERMVGMESIRRLFITNLFLK